MSAHSFPITVEQYDRFKELQSAIQSLQHDLSVASTFVLAQHHVTDRCGVIEFRAATATSPDPVIVVDLPDPPAETPPA